MQECILQSDYNYMFENMSSEEINTLLQTSPQVFQGAAHTLCKINESNKIVGQATVFDTKKGRDK
jgi:hypothetical protein